MGTVEIHLARVADCDQKSKRMWKRQEMCFFKPIQSLHLYQDVYILAQKILIAQLWCKPSQIFIARLALALII